MIAVTGAAGFIGSVLVARLNDMGHDDIVAVDQNAHQSPKWGNLSKKRYKLYLESGEFLERLEKGEFNGRLNTIFHLGACSDTTEKNADFLKKNNTEYSERVASWSVAQGAYLAYASSAATYGAGELGFSDNDALTPRLKPLNLYGQSKLAFDQWVLKNNLQTKITGFRFFNVYGPNEYHKGDMRSLVLKGFEQVQAAGKLRLFKSYKKEYSDGGQKRDFIYVKDAVEAVLWFHAHPDKKGIFNLGTGRAQTWNDLADALFKACGKPKTIEYIDMPDSIKNQYQYFTEADLTKLRKAGCPTVFHGLEESVRDYVSSYLSKQDRVA